MTASKTLAPFLGQPGRNGGTLRRGNPGQRGTLALLQASATHDLREALKLARTMLQDADRPDAVRLAAAEFIRRCTGLDRAPPPPRKRGPEFSIVRAAADEIARALDPAGPPGVKRIEGPQTGKGLGGTRDAALPGGSPHEGEGS